MSKINNEVAAEHTPAGTLRGRRGMPAPGRAMTVTTARRRAFRRFGGPAPTRRRISRIRRRPAAANILQTAVSRHHV
jgi:hypothetical protein